MNSKGGFYFVATVLDTKLSLPVQITPSIIFDKASQEQQALIINLLQKDKLGFAPTVSYYQTNTVRDNPPNENRYHHVPIPEEQWRYYVINFDGSSNYEMHEFFLIADLVAPHLSSYLHAYTSEPFGKGEITGWGYDGLGSHAFYGKMIRAREPREFNEQSIDTLKQIYGKYKALDNLNHEGILRALHLNGNIHRIYNLNNLLVLALFMIIEMLLTHNPNNKELGDSLSHQIKTKIALLEKRLKHPIDYSVFGAMKSDKIWSKLYQFRSKIAHGEHIDFSSGDLASLISAEISEDFLYYATRLLLVHALEEPDLINSLKPI